MSDQELQNALQDMAQDYKYLESILLDAQKVKE